MVLASSFNQTPSYRKSLPASARVLEPLSYTFTISLLSLKLLRFHRAMPRCPSGSPQTLGQAPSALRFSSCLDFDSCPTPISDLSQYPPEKKPLINIT